MTFSTKHKVALLQITSIYQSLTRRVYLQTYDRFSTPSYSAVIMIDKNTCYTLTYVTRPNKCNKRGDYHGTLHHRLDYKQEVNETYTSLSCK